MSNRVKRSIGAITLPEDVESDREIIRLLREERVVVHFTCPEFDAYVKAPDGIVHEFTALYNYNDSDHDLEWQRTSIDSFTLKRELRRREFDIVVDDSQTPFSDR